MLRWVEVKRQLTWRFWATRILPVGLFMALTLHFGNVVYLYLTVSFIQMLKARRHFLLQWTLGKNIYTYACWQHCRHLRPL